MINTLKNFAAARSNAAIAAIDLTCVYTLNPGSSGFPVPGSGTDQNFYVTVFDGTLGTPDMDQNREICLVTANSAGILTWTRAQLGTAASSHPAGAKIVAAITDQDIKLLASGLGDYAIDTGSVNALVANPTMYPAVLVAGMQACVKVANTNTSAAAPTLNYGGTGVINILRQSGATPSANEIVANKIMTFVFDGTNWIITSPVGLQSEVWVNTGNGNGATNTMIRRFSNIVKNVGLAITYADSAANGGSFTLNEAGLYSITYVDQDTASPTTGISVNSNQLTTGIQTITGTNVLALGTIPTGGAVCCSILYRATAGDVIRAHSNQTSHPTGTTAQSTMMRVVKVSD